MNHSLFTLKMCSWNKYLVLKVGFLHHEERKSSWITGDFRTVPYLAGGNASAACLKILVVRFAVVQ